MSGVDHRAFLSPEFLIRAARDPWELRGAAELRRRTFCEEQRLFEGHDRDEIDAVALPLVAISTYAAEACEVVGTVRIHEESPGVWWGSRLAVAPSHRRVGRLGAELIRLAVSTAVGRGCESFRAHVQARNVPLFKRLAWAEEARVELRGAPHARMRADLGAYPAILDPFAGWAARGAGLMDIAALAAELAADRNLLGKEDIAAACAMLGLDAGAPGRPGDDCAAIPDADGYALFATEGFIDGFVAADPWFAGWCGVMVNISDVLAMGGRPVAVTNAVWAPDAAAARPVLEGMRAAAAAYGVPVVGGHTNLRSAGPRLAVSVLGRARALITSFDARPGDALVAAVDHRGEWRAPFDNWQAALGAPPERLRGDMEILPGLAEDGLVAAGKDISQGGIVGTALMLAECSGVGIDIDPGAIPVPAGVELRRWLGAFPSFGFLLAVAPEQVEVVRGRFAARGITAAAIGRVVPGSALRLVSGAAAAVVRDHAARPYLGLGAKEAADA